MKMLVLIAAIMSLSSSFVCASTPGSVQTINCKSIEKNRLINSIYINIELGVTYRDSSLEKPKQGALISFMDENRNKYDSDFFEFNESADVLAFSKVRQFHPAAPVEYRLEISKANGRAYLQMRAIGSGQEKSRIYQCK